MSTKQNPEIIDLVPGKDGVYRPSGKSRLSSKKPTQVYRKHVKKVSPLQEFFNRIIEGLETLQQIEAQVRRFR